MPHIVKPKYQHHFMLSVEVSTMLAEQTGMENRTKTAIVEDAIREYCYNYKAELLKEYPDDNS